ncbi:XrtA/PEP-CTERM system TPR-repeat protein PrsT [Methylomarinovum caldicuralii]|nr:XrtA/PEP-CTERM system TPR-repeat protein PrsT [Methylomarinovum caldicuralii]
MLSRLGSTLNQHHGKLLPVALLFLLCSCSQSLTDTEHLARAKQFREKGELRTSMIELKEALQQNPNNIEARRLLGTIYLALGNGAAAEKELRRAVDLGLAREAILLPLAEALQLQGRNQKILDEIDVPASLPPKDQAALAAYRGDAWLALGEREKAQAEYQRALTLDPQSPRGKLGMAYLAAPKNLDEALKLLDEGLATDPQDGHLWRYKAKLLQHRGELKAAEAAYDKAIGLLAFDAEDWANRTLIHIQLKELERAEQEIKHLKQAAPKFYLTHFAEGYLRIAQNRPKDARAPLERALELKPDYPPTLFYLGLVYLTNGELEQAERQFTRFRHLRPNDPQGNKFLALVKFRQKEYSSARRLLMPVVLSNPDDRFALKLLADIETAAGNLQEALRYRKQLASLAPSDSLVQTRLGITLLAVGQSEAGLKVLQQAASEAPSDAPQPEIALTLAYLKEKKFAEATEVINRLKNKLAEHPLPLNLEAMWHEAQGNDAEAIRALEKALAIAPNDPVTGEHLVRLLLQRNQRQKARRLLESLAAAHPDDAKLRLALAKLDLEDRRFDAMVENLQAVVDKHPEALEARLLLAKYYLQFGQPQRAQTLLAAIRSRHPDDPALLSLLAKAQLAARLPHRALETAKHLTKTDPDSPMGYYLLAQAHLQTGDHEAFRQALQTSLKLAPDFLPARHAWIKLLAMEGKTKAVERELSQLAAKYPDNPQVLALQAWWAMRQHHPRQAVALYEKLLQRQPSSETVRNLAKALWQAGKPAEAIARLETWTHDRPRDADALYLLALMYQQAGDEAKSRQALQRTLQAAPNHVLALNDLAWRLRRTAPRQAMEYAERAARIAPGAAWIADTLGAVLLENHEDERALRVLQEAAERAPQNPMIRYHLALAQYRQGLNDEARVNLRQALASKMGFAERPQAQALLERLGR